jgi:mono/diheme cytochrome c family protein
MSLSSPTSLDRTLSFRQGFKIRVPEKRVVAQTGEVCYGTASRLRKKGLPQPAPSLLSLPKGEKIKGRSQLLCRVLKAKITATARKLLFPHPAKELNGQRAGTNPACCATLMAAAFAIAAAALCNGIAGASGAALFVTHCTVCHQADGQGIPGMYPPLADSAGDFAHSRDGRAYLVHVLSFGLNGPIAVHGARYNGFMQSWAQLSDDDIAQLLNHVLTNFNAKLLPKDFAPFTVPEVKRDRARPMTSSEVYRELQTLGTVSVKAEAK